LFDSPPGRLQRLTLDHALFSILGIFYSQPCQKQLKPEELLNGMNAKLEIQTLIGYDGWGQQARADVAALVLLSGRRVRLPLLAGAAATAAAWRPRTPL